MNRFIWSLMTADMLLLSGFGFVQPFLAVFIKENVVGGSLVTAGLAAALYLIVKSLVQVPFSIRVDRASDIANASWLVIGLGLQAIAPIIFILAHSIWPILLAQVIYGLGGGLNYATWYKLWNKYLDKNRESLEWSTYDAVVGLTTALVAFGGAWLADRFGFPVAFLAVEALIIGSLIPTLYLRRSLRRPA